MVPISSKRGRKRTRRLRTHRKRRGHGDKSRKRSAERRHSSRSSSGMSDFGYTHAEKGKHAQHEAKNIGTAASEEFIHGVIQKLKTVVAPHRIKKSDRVKKLEGRWSFSDQFYGTVQSSEGQQGVKTVMRVLHQGDLITTYSFPANGPDYTYFQTKYPLFLQNPNSKITGAGSSTFGSNSSYPAGGQYDIIHIEKVDLQMQLANFTTTPTIVDVYVLEKKNTDQYLSDADWSSVCVNSNVALGSIAANAGVTGGIYSGPTLGVVPSTYLGVKPFEYTPFGKLYKVKAFKSIELAADTNVIFDIELIIDRYLDATSLYRMSANGQTSAAPYGFKNLSMDIMLVTRTGLVKTTSVGNSNVTTGVGEIGYVINRRYFCQPALQSVSRVRQDVAIPYLIGNGTAANETEINVADALAGVIQLV